MTEIKSGNDVGSLRVALLLGSKTKLFVAWNMAEVLNVSTRPRVVHVVAHSGLR